MTTYNLWGSDPITPVNDSMEGTGVNLGVVLLFTVPGQVTHLRFYEQSDSDNVVTLRIIDTDGTVQASATYDTTLGATGWREVALAAPWTPTVGTWYMVYYHVPYFAGSANNSFYGLYFQDLNTSRASADGAIVTMDSQSGVVFNGSQLNGRYGYGGSPAIPTQSYNHANYAVDVVFSTGPRVLEQYSASFTAAAGVPTGADLTFATTPQAGDLVFVVMWIDGTGGGVTPSVTGLGATYTVAKQQQFSVNNKFWLYVGTGANAAGIVRPVFNSGLNRAARVSAMLVRGLPSATIYHEQLSAWATGDSMGPGNSQNYSAPVGPDTLVLDVHLSQSQNSTFPSAVSTAGFTVDSAAMGGGWVKQAWQAFGAVNPNVTIGATQGASNGYISQAVYYIGGPDGARLTSEYAEVATRGGASAAALDGQYAEVLRRDSAVSALALDATYTEALTPPIAIPPLSVVASAFGVYAGAGLSASVSLGFTPEPTDYVVACVGIMTGDTRSVVTSISGLGATWVKGGESLNQLTGGQVFFVGTGATSAGTVTVTTSLSRVTIVDVYVVRGLTAPPYLELSSNGSNGTGGVINGVAFSARPGSIVFGEINVSKGAADVFSWPLTQTPPGAWVVSTLRGPTFGDMQNSGYAIPTSLGIVNTSMQNSALYSGRITQLLVMGVSAAALPVEGAMGFWGMLL